jgi:hypothetical protein
MYLAPRSPWRWIDLSTVPPMVSFTMSQNSHS